MLGTNIVLLNTEEDVKALLISRNANYSHRMSFPMVTLWVF